MCTDSARFGQTGGYGDHGGDEGSLFDIPILLVTENGVLDGLGSDEAG